MSTPQRGGKATRRPGSPPLPRGGGMAGGIKGEEQDDDGGFEGGRKKAQTPETDAALENLDTMTTVEYNRWLVTENNWSMAEASRQQRIEGEQFRKTREDRHRERGQMRQQDTVEQMKEAKTKVDAHRRSNLEVGSAVKREVIAWNAAAHEDKQKWIKFAQSVKSALNAADVRVNRDELIATKKQNGVEVRSEVQGLTVEKEKLREAYLSANKKQMEKVKEETADKVLDESKKVRTARTQRAHCHWHTRYMRAGAREGGCEDGEGALAGAHPWCSGPTPICKTERVSACNVAAAPHRRRARSVSAPASAHAHTARVQTH